MRVGFVGCRGMVGSVLVDRMLEEGDFSLGFEPCFFSTSKQGEIGPLGLELANANSNKNLKACDVIVACQGSEWSKRAYRKLALSCWKGVWIDSSSAFRMSPNSIIVLDPINGEAIRQGLRTGVKKFIGGNCTVSLMLLALHDLFKERLVEWIITDTYQAASGAGAHHMIELIKQMAFIARFQNPENPAISALELDRQVGMALNHPPFPGEIFGVPLACSLIPAIDNFLKNGQTKEEWKSIAEANKILQLKKILRIGGTCVRIGSMRCHSQALTVKLRKTMRIASVANIIRAANPMVDFVQNTKKETEQRLTPAATSGVLDIRIGRIRHSQINPLIIHAFTVGDQLLWGAAEPIRRTLRIVLEEIA